MLSIFVASSRLVSIVTCRWKIFCIVIVNIYICIFIYCLWLLYSSMARVVMAWKCFEFSLTGVFNCRAAKLLFLPQRQTELRQANRVYIYIYVCFGNVSMNRNFNLGARPQAKKKMNSVNPIHHLFIPLFFVMTIITFSNLKFEWKEKTRH